MAVLTSILDGIINIIIIIIIIVIIIIISLQHVWRYPTYRVPFQPTGTNIVTNTAPTPGVSHSDLFCVF